MILDIPSASRIITPLARRLCQSAFTLGSCSLGALALAMSFQANALADTIHLYNGQTISLCKIREVVGDLIYFSTPGGHSRQISRMQVNGVHDKVFVRKHSGSDVTGRLLYLTPYGIEVESTEGRVRFLRVRVKHITLGEPKQSNQEPPIFLKPDGTVAPSFSPGTEPGMGDAPGNAKPDAFSPNASPLQQQGVGGYDTGAQMGPLDAPPEVLPRTMPLEVPEDSSQEPAPGEEPRFPDGLTLPESQSRRSLPTDHAISSVPGMLEAFEVAIEPGSVEETPADALGLREAGNTPSTETVQGLDALTTPPDQHARTGSDGQHQEPIENTNRKKAPTTLDVEKRHPLTPPWLNPLKPVDNPLP